MSAQDAAREDVAGSEGVPGGPVAPRPLRLGDALTFAPPRWTTEQDQVRVESAAPVVLISPLGITALRHWLACIQENPEDDAELELWTASGIAKETGTARGTVYKWIERDDFPGRFAHPVGGAPVWEADRVRAWLLTSRPPMGRPKAS